MAGSDSIQQASVERILVDIANAQGGMERLKNTPLPYQYRFYPNVFTRLFCVLLPIGLVETLQYRHPGRFNRGRLDVSGGVQNRR